MGVQFADHFWGEKHMGFSVLYQSTKGSAGTAKELADFLKDRVSLEEEHARHLAKSLAKAAHLAAADHSLKGAWGLTKTALERLQTAQARLTLSLGDLAKEVAKYGDELTKKHKSLKDQEHPTFDAVNLIQTTTTCLQKAKETYTTRCVELEKLRREAGAPKEITKAENKAKKARDEYNTYLGKYEEVRTKFTACLEKSASHFQAQEEAHLNKMRALMSSFAKHTMESQQVGSQVCEELSVALEHMDTDEVLGDFVERKGTGQERPGVVVFEEPDLATLLPPPPPAITPASPLESAEVNGTAAPVINAAFTPSVPSLLSLDSLPPTAPAPAASNRGAAEGDLLNLGADEVASIASSTSSSTAKEGKENDGSGSRSKLRLQFGSWSKGNKDRASPATTPADHASSAPPAAQPEQSEPTETVKDGSVAPEVDLALPSIDDDIGDTSPTASGQPQSSPRLVQSLRRPIPSRLPTSRIHGSLPSALPVPPTFGSLPNSVALSAHLRRPADAASAALLKPVVRPAIRLCLSPRQLSLRRCETFAGAPSVRFSAPVEAAPEERRGSEQTKRRGLSFRKGFFKKKSKKKSASKMEGDMSKFPPDKQLDGSGGQADNNGGPKVDAEGFVIREDAAPSLLSSQSRDSDFSSDEDEDASHRKIQVKINPLTSAGQNGTSGSLSDVISSMSIPSSSTSSLPPPLLPPTLPTLPKSRTMDERDPWAPGAAPPKVPLRPSLTGDGRLNATFGGEENAWTLPSGPMAPSLTGSSSRPRPRANTPTSYFSLHRQGAADGGASFSRSESLASLGDESVLGGSQYFENPGAKIPVAMALTETVHAKFSGTDPSKGQIRVFGSVHVSFPGSSIQALLSPNPPPPLTFTLTNAARLQALIPNKQVLSSASAFGSSASHVLAFDSAGLSTQLKRLTAARPGAPFYNLEVLRYEVRGPAPPLLLQLWWKAEAGATDLRVDYALNPANDFTKALLNPTFSVPLGGAKVGGLVARPDAELGPDAVVWRLTTLSGLAEEGKGSLKARLTHADGSAAPPPAPAALTFTVADASLSGAALEVNHEHYRLSLLKRKMVSGKYTVERGPQ